MLYDKEEVMNICKKYGIETIEKVGYPVYMGKEMDENFSFSEMMRQPVNYEDDNIVYSSKTVEFSLPIYIDAPSFCNCYSSIGSNDIVYKKENENVDVTSSIPCNNSNKYAA